MDYHILAGKQERLRRLMNLHFASFFEDLPLTSTQAITLDFIIQKSKCEDVFQKDLESFLSVRGSSVASLINYLERAGYISRIAADFDGRYKRLVPTELALDLQDDVADRIDRYIMSLFAGIPETELRVFEAVIEKMEANVKK